MGHSGDDAVYKISNKMKTFWPNRLKFLVNWYWLISSLLEQDTNRPTVYVILIQCPFKIS